MSTSQKEEEGLAFAGTYGKKLIHKQRAETNKLKHFIVLPREEKSRKSILYKSPGVLKFLNHVLLQKEPTTRPDAEGTVAPDFRKCLFQWG